MTPSFPNSPAPAWYRRARWNTAADKRNGVHYVGDTVTITLTAALAADVTYDVRDYFGNIVSTGSVASGTASFVPEPPASGWKPGWYRVYLTGTQFDANFAYSCGATNFCVIRDDPHFVHMPAGDTPGSFSGDFDDLLMKGVMGVGTTRMTIGNAANPTTGDRTLAQVSDQLAVTNTYWVDPGAPYADSERPRYAWVNFPNGTVDRINNQGTWYFMCKDGTVDGSQVFVQVSNGTAGGTKKIRVSYPDAGTLVETFDNLNPAVASGIASAVNGTSNYIVFEWDAVDGTLADQAQTAIGNAYFNGVASVVSTLYPLGCHHFEGPSNEPGMTSQNGTYLVQHMKLFAAAVHAGNASAKAIGPCPVTIDFIGSVGDPRGWYGFFNNGGHNYCDELSFHAYNSQVNGDINLGRTQFQDLLDVMADFGVSKLLWQTESTHAFTSVYGAYHPRRARVYLLQTLLMEQYGIVKEKNNAWYDTSHGFWSYPAWLEHEGGTLGPQAVLYRVLAEETWGKPYVSAVDFGTAGNAMYVGNVYTNGAGESTVALMATSYMTGASVVLTIAGTSDPITVVDGFGNERAMPQSKGRITLPMTDIPVYVELPVGASATVYRVNGHSPLGIGASVSPASTTKQVDGVTYSVIADDLYMSSYDTVGIAPTTFATPPSDTTLIWSGNKTIERVMVWCGPAWQASGTLVDFDVQTYDGVGWTTRTTVTKPDPPYFLFGSDSNDAGCFLETFWDEQWVFDVEFDSPISCQGVRLHVQQASFGGEVISDTTYGSSFGQGTAVEAYRIQEIAVTDANRYALAGA